MSDGIEWFKRSKVFFLRFWNRILRHYRILDFHFEPPKPENFGSIHVWWSKNHENVEVGLMLSLLSQSRHVSIRNIRNIIVATETCVFSTFSPSFLVLWCQKWLLLRIFDVFRNFHDLKYLTAGTGHVLLHTNRKISKLPKIDLEAPKLEYNAMLEGLGSNALA